MNRSTLNMLREYSCRLSECAAALLEKMEECDRRVKYRDDVLKLVNRLAWVRDLFDATHDYYSSVNSEGAPAFLGEALNLLQGMKVDIFNTFTRTNETWKNNPVNGGEDLENLDELLCNMRALLDMKEDTVYRNVVTLHIMTEPGVNPDTVVRHMINGTPGVASWCYVLTEGQAAPPVTHREFVVPDKTDSLSRWMMAHCGELRRKEIDA